MWSAGGACARASGADAGVGDRPLLPDAPYWSSNFTSDSVGVAGGGGGGLGYPWAGAAGSGVAAAPVGGGLGYPSAPV